jgi:hypothetical protein
MDTPGITLTEAIDRAILVVPKGDPAVIAQGIVSSDLIALLTAEITVLQNRALHLSAFRSGRFEAEAVDSALS